MYSVEMRKYYQLVLVIVCLISVVSLLIYRHEYNRLRYVLQVLNIFGKPGLTDSDLCVGLNATHLTALVKNSTSETLEVYPVFQRIDESFYAYSTFLRRFNRHLDLDIKLESNSITDTIVVGKNNVEPHFGCHIWFDDKDSPAIGKFSFIKVARGKNKAVRSHDLFVFHCKLKRDYGTPVGVSFYQNYADINPLYSPVHKLIDVSSKLTDNENVDKIRFVNKFNLAMCVVPNRIPHVSKSSIVEFLSFHQKMGVGEFIIYDGTLPHDITKKLSIIADDIIGAKLKFFPLNFPFSSNTSYGVMRDVVEVDCTYRNFKQNKDVYDKMSHVVTVSWDEYIVPRLHRSVKSLLNEIDSPRRIKQAEIPSLQFCLNQRDDPKTKPTYPLVVKKTHYDKSWVNDRQILVRSVGILTFDDIFPKDEDYEKKTTVRYNEKISSSIASVHKYTDCIDSKSARLHRNDDLAYAEFEMRPHQFEGAMIKYADDIYNSKLYTMYRIGKIWKLPRRYE